MSGVVSGISVSSALSEAFQSSSSTRVIKVSIENESLVPGGTVPLSSSFASDVEKIPALVDDSVPAYLLVRLDTPGKWALVSYVPDNSTVRLKMLYASTRSALTRGLGASSFVDSPFIANKGDIPSILVTRSTSSAPQPATAAESELASVRAAEAREQQERSKPRSHVAGVMIEWNEDAESAIKELGEAAGSEAKLVVLGIDQSAGEKIKLVSSVSLPASEGLTTSLPPSDPSYAFYSVPHNGQRSVLFIYACPTTSQARPRMVYAASRNMVVHWASQLGVKASKKVETSDLSELTHTFVTSELYTDLPAAGQQWRETPSPAGGVHPITSSEPRPFSRPRGPGRRAGA